MGSQVSGNITSILVDYNTEVKKDQILARLDSAREDTIGLEVKNALLKPEQTEANIPTVTQAVPQGEENMRVSKERFDD